MLIKPHISTNVYWSSKTDCSPQPSPIVIAPNGANLRIYPSDSLEAETPSGPGRGAGDAARERERRKRKPQSVIARAFTHVSQHARASIESPRVVPRLILDTSMRASARLRGSPRASHPGNGGCRAFYRPPPTPCPSAVTLSVALQYQTRQWALSLINSQMQY